MSVEPRFNGSIQELKCGLCGATLLKYRDFEIYKIVESGYSAELTYNHLIKEFHKTEQ